jgi:hypothetical protein
MASRSMWRSEEPDEVVLSWNRCQSRRAERYGSERGHGDCDDGLSDLGLRCGMLPARAAYWREVET